MKVFRGLESPVGKDAKGFAFAVQRIVGRVLDDANAEFVGRSLQANGDDHVGAFGGHGRVEGDDGGGAGSFHIVGGEMQEVAGLSWRGSTTITIKFPVSIVLMI